MLNLTHMYIPQYDIHVDSACILRIWILPMEGMSKQGDRLINVNIN